jgi:alanine-glyoxylate transaminase / serine-glyoxylate transaminase / serine-pyruvate transaminase
MSVLKSSNAPAARGRNFFFAPGPTNIPDRVLHAMSRATVDFLGDEFLALQARTTEGVRRILKTKGTVLFYAANGHGAWEASLANAFEPGEKVLVLESGYFSQGWADMARDLGLVVEIIPADWRTGVPLEAVEKRLAADSKGEIKAVLVTHNETATGLAYPIPGVRRALDKTNHRGLLLIDTISSLASIEVRMDEWGVDIVVGGSQKGLMAVTGMSFTGLSDKAIAKSRTIKPRKSYWNWEAMLATKPQRFPGTTPVHMFFAIDEGVRMLEEEGLDAVYRRHTRFARATRAAIAAWGDNAKSGTRISAKGFEGKVASLELLCADPSRASDSVSAIILPDGIDANAFRKHAFTAYNLDLGGGLGPLAGRVFRIGHMGDLNEPMLLGAIATVELAFSTFGVPHKANGVTAAIASLKDHAA